MDIKAEIHTFGILHVVVYVGVKVSTNTHRTLVQKCLRTECSVSPSVSGSKERDVKGRRRKLCNKETHNCTIYQILSTNQIKKEGLSKPCVTHWAT
jgi:hypothetical protein